MIHRKYFSGVGWVYHFFIYLFICWSNRMAPYFFATVLLLYAPSKVTSVLVLFAIFGSLCISVLLYSQAFIDFSYYFGGLFYSLCSFLCTPFAATCSQPITLRQMTVSFSILSYGFRYYLGLFELPLFLDRNYLYLNQK